MNSGVDNHKFVYPSITGAADSGLISSAPPIAATRPVAPLLPLSPTGMQQVESSKFRAFSPVSLNVAWEKMRPDGEAERGRGGDVEKENPIRNCPSSHDKDCPYFVNALALC